MKKRNFDYNPPLRLIWANAEDVGGDYRHGRGCKYILIVDVSVDIGVNVNVNVEMGLRGDVDANMDAGMLWM